MVKFRLTSQDLLQKLVLHHLEMSMDDNCRSFYELCEVPREPCVASRFDFDQRAAAHAFDNILPRRICSFPTKVFNDGYWAQPELWQ